MSTMNIATFLTHQTTDRTVASLIAELQKFPPGAVCTPYRYKYDDEVSGISIDHKKYDQLGRELPSKRIEFGYVSLTDGDTPAEVLEPALVD